MTNIFRPEDTGLSLLPDATAAVQKAFDDANAYAENNNAPAVVLLTGEYVISRGGDFAVGPTASPYVGEYGVWLRSGNVTIRGGGRLVVAARPISTARGLKIAYVTLMVGNGNVTQPRSANIVVEDITVENRLGDALTVTDLNEMSVLLSGNIAAVNCTALTIRSCQVLVAHGYCGGIVCHVQSDNYMVLDNFIDAETKYLNAPVCVAGIWCDGAQGAISRGNTILGSRNGIYVATTTDLNLAPSAVMIVHNILRGFQGCGIGVGGGKQVMIVGNTLETHYHVVSYIYLLSSRNSRGEWIASEHFVSGNTCHSTKNTTKPTGEMIKIVTVGESGATPSMDHVIQNNIVTGSPLAASLRCDSEAVDNIIFRCNTVTAPVVGAAPVEAYTTYWGMPSAVPLPLVA